jgi:outer membrane protein assembly factor BamA
MPEFFVLNRISLSADVVIDPQELSALTGLSEGIITKEKFQQAFSIICKKQKFDRAFVSLTPQGDGYALIVHFHAFWTLAKVYITGNMIGKDRYRHHYQGEPGEVFDEIKHKHGLHQISAILKTEGYLDSQLTDDLIYDPTTKSVNVTIFIQQGKQFIIDDVVLTVSGADAQNVEHLGATLQKMMYRDLKHAHYSKSLLNETARQLKKILFRKGYLDVTVELEESLHKEQARVRLYWSINIRHKKAVEFIGNLFFSSEELLEQLLLFGKSLALIPPSLLAEEIVLGYKKKGFFDAHIAWHEEKEAIFFCVTEGRRATISTVHLEGATAYSPLDIVHNYFSSLINVSSFDADNIKQALDRMSQDYIKDGFWDIKIVSYDYIPLPDGTYELRICIHEGKRRFLTKTSIPDFEQLEKEGPMSIVCSRDTPIPFNLYLVQEQRFWLTHYLQENGYLYATPHLELIFSPKTTGDVCIEMRWDIRGYKEQVRFGPTIVLGSNSLPASIILRELRYHAGDVWSKPQMDRSMQRLKSLGIFDTVSLALDNMLEAEPYKTVLVRCFLDDPVELRARGGVQIVGRNLTYKGGVTYKVGASMVIKNPTNRADLFSLDVDFTRYRRDMVAYYRIPWLGTVPLKTEMRVYSSSYDQPIVEGSNELLYKAVHNGLLLEFTKDMFNKQLVTNVGIEWMALQGVSPQRALALHFEPRLIDTYIPYFFGESSLLLDYLDDKVYPTQGAFTLLSCKGMIPFDLSRAFFIKMLVEQSFFIPLPASTVLALRLRLGHIMYESFRLIMPPERFYLGGYHSLRGYNPDLAPPLNCFTDCQGIQHLIPIGGKSMMSGTVEWRFPLFSPIWAALFTDFGFLAQDSWASINASDILVASGFGLRYTTPFGPISFDIGWKWHKQSPLERSFAWFLTFGQAF